VSETRSRYPGTRPFSDSADDVARFFGRDTEAEELYLRVLSVPLLVQFGNSGLGKTSLLQAGLFPRLRQKPFLPVMIRLNNADESLTAAVARAIRESCESEGIEATHRSTDGLWELVSTTTVWRDDLLLTPVLVFDQFEEVFTLRDAAFRAEIATELGALASGIPPARVQGSSRRPNAKVLISLREDYLGALEEFSAAIPGLFQERMRLGPLTEEAACDAITGPARLDAPDLSPPFAFDPAALDMMMDELKGKSGVIEPFQLQLLARHAESVAARKGAGARLTPEDFRGTHDFESVLKNFYRDTLQRISPRSQRVKAQLLSEEGLLGAAGHRLMLEERQIESEYDVTQETLQTLESSRLIRRERRLESVFYEISHDRIADSIFRGRTAKLPRKVRQALWAAALAALAIVAVLLVVNQRVSRERDVAERWMRVLLGQEFFGELRDSGRSAASKRLQEQIASDSKDELSSAYTRGLALRNHGDIRRLDGTLPEALASFRAALAELDSAPRETAVVRALARTHDRIGEALAQQGQLKAATQHYDAAIRMWHDVVAAKPQNVNDDCMGLAESLTAAARLNVRTGHTAAALRYCDEAFAIAFGASFDTADRCGGRPGAVEPNPEVNAMHVLALIALAQSDMVWDPVAIEGAATLATRARELRPPSMKASALALETLAARGYVRNAGHSAPDVGDYLRIVAELGAMQRWDGDNRMWQFERAVTQLLVADAWAGCTTGCTPGMLDDAEIQVEEAEATLRTLGAADPANRSIQDYLWWALRTHAVLLAARGPAFRSASMALFDEAERVHARLPGDGSDLNAADDLGNLLTTKAGALARLGDLPDGLATIRRARTILTRARHEHPDRWASRMLLSSATAMESQFQSAATNGAKPAVVPLDEQQQADTEALDRLLLSGIHHRLAGTALLATDPAGALRELNASEVELRSSMRRRPTHAEGYFQLIRTYLGMQGAYEKLGKPEERLYALAAATTAAQLAQWLAPADRRHDANESLLATRYTLSNALIAQNRPAEALAVLEDLMTLGQELLAEPTPDGRALAILGDAKCGTALVQRRLGHAGWKDTLRGGLVYLRKATAADPAQEKKLRYWTAVLDGAH
jgi:tetratricopeptide (TPR) repeat protein